MVLVRWVVLPLLFAGLLVGGWYGVTAAYGEADLRGRLDDAALRERVRSDARLSLARTVRLDGTDVTVRGLEQLEKLKRLRSVNIDGLNGTVEELEEIRHNLPRITFTGKLAPRALDYSSRGERFGSRELQVLCGCYHVGKVEKLNLSGTAVSDEGIASLSEWTELRELNLRDTPVTSRSMLSLVGMDSLRVVKIRGTSIDRSAASLLRVAGPEQIRVEP